MNQALRGTCAISQIRVLPIGIDLETSDQALCAAMSSRLRQSLEFGEVFAASHMVLHSPFVWFGHPLVYYAPGEERQGVNDATHAIIEPLLPLAERIGCTLVFECCDDLNPDPQLALIRSFDSDYVRLSVDVGHAFIMQRLGCPSPTSGFTRASWISRARPRCSPPRASHVDVNSAGGAC